MNQKISLVLIILFGILLANCASQKLNTRFTEKEKAKFSNTLLIVEIPQEEIEVTIDQQETFAYMFRRQAVAGFVVGSLIDIFVNEIKRSNQKELLKDVFIALRSVDFRKEFSVSLESSLKRISWIDLKKTIQLSKIGRKELKTKLINMDYDSLVHVRVEYRMLSNFEQIQMTAYYNVYNKTDGFKPFYKSHMGYTSLWKRHPNREYAVKSWVENGGERIKSEVRKGISLLAGQLSFDFEH